MIKTVHYLGNYIRSNEDNEYIGNIPGRLKMRYMADSIKKAGFNITILSFCKSKGDDFGVKLSQTIKIDKQETLKYITSFTGNSLLSKLLNKILLILQLVFYVIFNVNKNDTIILYHSITTTKWLSYLKPLIKVNIILEVEEIYGYSAIGDLTFVKNEIKNIKKFDNHIVVNDIIPRELNLNEDDFIVCYGVCNIPYRESKRFDDAIHVVYAGTIEEHKRGAFTAIATAEHLPNNYRLHILGFGKGKAIETAKKEIERINKFIDFEKVQYHGMLKGKELTNFLHKCHIGLSAYVMRSKFSNSVFPSKLTTYVCHDLEVVIGYADCYEKAKISNNWVYYYEHKPTAIAEAIKKVRVCTDFANKHEIIKRIDMDLIEWLRRKC